MGGHELAGIQVLVTRPAGQGKTLARLIAAHGGTAVEVPLLTIAPLPNPASAALRRADLVIFISANAVLHAQDLLLHLPAAAQVVAIGQATATALQTAGVRVDLLPARFDSEALLAMSALQDLQGKQVVIVRGVGGRERLAETFRARGAQLEYLEVYRRDCPDWSSADVQHALRADIITITSGEALDNLARLAQQHHAADLLDKPLAVFHERIASRARQQGFTLKPFIAPQASDAALVAAVLDWRQQQGV